MSRYPVAGGDMAALRSLMRGRVRRLARGAVRVVSCYEAGFDGFWLHRWLAGEGSSITGSTRRASS